MPQAKFICRLDKTGYRLISDCFANQPRWAAALLQSSASASLRSRLISLLDLMSASSTFGAHQSGHNP